MNESSIGLYDPIFAHKDVVKITGVPDRTLLTWLHRGVIRPYKERFTEKRGKRIYAPIDVFVIGVIYRTTIMTKIPPSEINLEVDLAVTERAQELFDDQYQEYMKANALEPALPDVVKGHRDPLLLVLQIIGADQIFADAIKTSKIGELYQRKPDQSVVITDEPHVVVPIDNILFSIAHQIFEALSEK